MSQFGCLIPYLWTAQLAYLLISVLVGMQSNWCLFVCVLMWDKVGHVTQPSWFYHCNINLSKGGPGLEPENKHLYCKYTPYRVTCISLCVPISFCKHKFKDKILALTWIGAQIGVLFKFNLILTTLYRAWTHALIRCEMRTQVFFRFV